MLLPKSYAGSLQVALSTQTTTHTAQQPLNGLRTALKKISRSVNAAFSAVPVAKFEQQTAAAAVSANKAAKAQAKLASGTTKAAKAAKRSVAEFESWTGCRLLLPKVPELRRLPPPQKQQRCNNQSRRCRTATVKSAGSIKPAAAKFLGYITGCACPRRRAVGCSLAADENRCPDRLAGSFGRHSADLGRVRPAHCPECRPGAGKPARHFYHPVAERFAADPY